MHGPLTRESDQPEPDRVTLTSRGDHHMVIEPQVLDTPLVFASPHSGRHYPESMMRECAATIMDLRRIEDAYIDKLFDETPQLGAPLIHALVGRAFLDLNRAPTELDTTMFNAPLDMIASVVRTPRVAAGLGCIPRVAHGGVDIYNGKLSANAAQLRLEEIYHPYHDALDALLDRALERFGVSFLIDCHSMPSRTDGGSPMPDIVLGDRFGAACTPALTRLLERELKSRGYSVVRNSPYAGGHITLSRGRPNQKRHAIQIEINRKLYLDENRVVTTNGFSRLKRDLNQCFSTIADWSRQFARLA